MNQSITSRASASGIWARGGGRGRRPLRPPPSRPGRDPGQDVVADLHHVAVVQRGVDLVQDEERGRADAVHREEQRQRRHRLLPARRDSANTAGEGGRGPPQSPGGIAALNKSGLLPARQLLHLPEPLRERHRIATSTFPAPPHFFVWACVTMPRTPGTCNL